jgi:hypothetical protein
VTKKVVGVFGRFLRYAASIHTLLVPTVDLLLQPTCSVQAGTDKITAQNNVEITV